MTHPIYPCLWFNGQAQEAARFYGSIFGNVKVLDENPLVIVFELDGVEIMGLNGGSRFQFNPSISFFVTCETDKEVQHYWERLTVGGQVLMPLDKYDWSENYGWCNDKYGLSWQIYKGRMSDVNQRIVPLLMFANKQYGNAEKAVNYYSSLFENSRIEGIMHYGSENPATEGKVMHAQFVLNDRVFMAMDAPGEHPFEFNEAVSFVVECDTQEEIDKYWDAFTKNGQESMCGWCKDEFGVSWQIIPAVLKDLMADPDKRQRVTEAFLKMKKMELAVLLNA